jgi:hypothetical protein
MGEIDHLALVEVIHGRVQDHPPLFLLIVARAFRHDCLQRKKAASPGGLLHGKERELARSVVNRARVLTAIAGSTEGLGITDVITTALGQRDNMI